MARILLVDDEVHVLGALRRLLRREGFSIELALSGDEALEKLATFAPDVVISDLKMRGMNGLQLLDQVRRRAPEVVRVMMSGHADPNSMGSEPGAEFIPCIALFISKPWDDAKLIADVRALLQERASSSGKA